MKAVENNPTTATNGNEPEPDREPPIRLTMPPSTLSSSTSVSSTARLNRRAQMTRPMAPPLAIDDSGADSGVQLPLIGRQQRQGGRRRRSDVNGSADKLAALGPSSRPRTGLRMFVEFDAEDDDNSLARLSLCASEAKSGRRQRLHEATYRPQQRHQLRLQSAEHEGQTAAERQYQRPVGTDVPPSDIAPSRLSAPPPTVGGAASGQTSPTRYAVLNGRTRTEAADFDAFARRHREIWHRVAPTVQSMERFLAVYSVPLAFVNGEKLAALAELLQLDRPDFQYVMPSQLLDCLINRSDVARLVSQPGRRFAGQDGHNRACAIIQAHWRGFLQRQRYRQYLRKRWAAGVIAAEWLLRLRLGDMHTRLIEARARHLEGFRRRFRQLGRSWKDWQLQRRIVIHVPSLGYPQRARERLDNFSQLQGLQMGRLCDIRDPNVDVVLLCPQPLSSELTQYYSKLAALLPAIRSGRAEDQRDTRQRFRIVVPEAAAQFASRNLCLSTLLSYSPRALTDIRDAVAGRRAYIVPGLPCTDDLAVADKLDVPILCPEPDLVRQFGSGSGARSLLQDAGVATPPGESGIGSLSHLVETLARLITPNLDVQRWHLRLDDCPATFADVADQSGSAAWLNVQRLDCHRWALEERQRLGGKWAQLWAQERVYLRVMDELQQRLSQLLDAGFLANFVASGGSVQAEVADNSSSAVVVTADLCVEPTGAVRVVSTADRRQGSSELESATTGLQPLSVPQTALQPTDLADLCRRLGAACTRRRIFGHVSVDFVVDASSTAEKLGAVTATGLRLQYSDTAALAQVMQFATNNAQLDAAAEALLVPPRTSQRQRQQRPRPKTATAATGSSSATPAAGCLRRFGAMSASLIHPGLSTIDYGAFFKLCKSRSVGFDVADLTGTLFCLVDSARRDRLCLLTLAEEPELARQEFGRVLAAIEAGVGLGDVEKKAENDEAMAQEHSGRKA